MTSRSNIQISKYAPSIFQGKIAFAAPRQFSLTIEHPAERIAFRVLAGALLLLGLTYLYFVSATVLNVVARRQASVQSTKLATDVSLLESQYFAASEDVKPENAGELGLVPVAHTAYVYRPGNAAAASVAPTRHNEI